MPDTKDITGGCYCGKVRYSARNATTSLIECHCMQCRKQSGHRYATAAIVAADFALEGEQNITLFQASEAAERGFCSACGSHLFWRSSTDDKMAILAGTIDDPSGMVLGSHIFVGDKGCYYDLDDGLPQFDGYDTPVG